ncbi:histidine kinase [Saccharothrix sp. NRRL B-16348]|uniref:sensor histidine kinase n=1 Tax=Saccharothrix sp. NRRL B-16348 TaxID=1415542 RepID=UPI0003C94D72|nr:sensor histidine kinase [Saccharothrix sp. NRRL B-16348]AGZ94321.1 histidine kinase [Saccharothrix sp. NRRL B-16348]KOX18627.1 histidine kinase [Saccharothrix sp. NRRL B-16348]
MADERSREGGHEPVWARWRRPGPTAAQRRNDVWVALAALAGAVAVTVLINSMGASLWESGPPLAEQLAWGAALTLPLVARRRYPLTVMFVVGALLIVVQTRQVGDNLVPSVALFLAIFSAGAWGQDRTRARWARIAVIVAMFGWLGFGLVRFLVSPLPPFEGAAGPLDPVLATVLYGIGFNVLFFLSAYFFGEMAWVSARRQAELEHRAEQLRRSQEQNTRGAIVAERVRIARDLHDVVAHHVSVMGVQAGAARRVLDRDPELAREALRTVEDTARTAIGELRGLLGVLRADQEDVPEKTGETSSPGLDQLPELAELARSAGLDVEHGVYGEPRPVPEGVALSVYRIVQESLTNVVKHADARKADVRVRFLENSLEVEVADDGRGPKGTSAGTAGFGLVGMRERVAVHGGELEVGPRRDAGYRVRARFPA